MRAKARNPKMMMTCMTNELQIRQPFDKRTLDPSHYFQSFVAKASGMGLLQNTEEIRRTVLLLAAKMAQRFTFGASSSVTVEAAQGLLESAIYCIGRRLKAAHPNEALKLLETLCVEQIWNEGKTLLRNDLSEARTKLGQMQESAVKTENLAYNSTLFEALPSFFTAYDIEYSAHELPCLIDYPLCVEPPALTGVEYILEYLKRLGIENSFCTGYQEEIEPLFRGYSRNWRDLNTNIFELVLTNVIGRILCGKGTAELDIDADDRERIQRSLNSATVGRLKSIVSMAAQRICSGSGLGQAERDYVQKAASQFVPRIKNALETDSLAAVFVSLKFADAHAMRFEDSSAMEDEQFRAVTEEIRSCRHVSDKLELINRNIKSIGDLADMLGASCLFADEYEAYFETLDETALALLYKRLPEEGALHITEGEDEWRLAFLDYLKRKGNAERIMEAAEYVELI